MYALVENNEIKEILINTRALTINDIHYPKNIFTLWSVEEKEAIGIYEIVYDNSNKKDGTFYTNTDVSHAFADGKVTASYGTATGKKVEDTVNADDSITLGLRSLKKENIKQQANNLLTTTDWYIIKAVDVESYSAPANIVTYRANIRSKSNEMETAIENAADIDALAALYVYTDGSRPLGEFPTLET